ncbi:YitT family protein [Nocardioides sp.]|uniref:membrane protein YczE n=1 Tax=Nocardioides sp. TaxID=35761 RepID=UPI00351208CF
MSTPAPTPAPALVDLGPVAQLRAGRLAHRLVQLHVGLVLYGVSLAMMVRGDLGLAPWDVLHSGLARYLPLDLGQVLIVVSFLVLLAWIPLREVPGYGTIANAIVLGLAADATLAVLERPDDVAARLALMLGGILACGTATACYIGAQLGRGPRDGLMTGLHRRTGLSLRLVRTALEITVVVLGLALGGHLGPGTVLFALTIGPITQALLPAFVVALPTPADVGGGAPVSDASR